jgi:ribosomal protein L35AE/L33A
MADTKEINVYETIKSISFQVDTNTNVVNINKVIIEGDGGTGATNLGYTPSATNGIVTSDTGADATIPLADSTNAGLLTPAEKTKLQGIATGAEVNVNADWNATSGDAQILNKPTIPTATNQITNNGSDGVNPFITALDIPTAGTASTIVREVKNMTGATLTKGTVVYISGANGNKALVSKALATTDALSARTFGLLQSDILNNSLGNCVIIGDLTGIDTSSFAEGAQLYLSGTVAGTYTATKNLAPTHLVYVGKVTRSHPTQGQIEVGIQNGYELEEIHDCQVTTPTNNDGLFYETSTDLWKNKSIATVLGYTPANDSNVVHKTGDETIAGIKTFSSNPKIPINYGNTGVGSLIIDNGLGELGVASNYVYPNLTELSYLRGITSSVQTQINSKQATLTSSIFGSFVNALNLKSFLVDNDSVSINDSADSNNAKKITWSLVWTTYLKNKADALYATISNLDLKQDKSLSAYTLIANNTNATANGGNQAFKSLAQQAYTGTIVVTATTSPSGATNHSYSFTQVGKLVTLRINLDWATTGNTVSSIACELPSDCPTPELPTAVSATGDVIVYGTGTLSANRAIVGAMGIMALRIKSSGVYEVVVTRTGASFNKAYYSIQYFTA